MILKTREKDIFIQYLSIKLESSKGIMKQIEKLGPIGKVLIKREKLAQVAYSIVLKELQEGESMTIEKEPTDDI